MIQGTTPTIKLMLPFDTSRVAEAEFTLSDYEKVVDKWTLDRMKAEGSILSIELTQEETLRLEPKMHKAQLRVKTTEGKVMATKIMPVSVSDLLSEDVI